MAEFTRRTQVLLDDERYERLRRRAEERGASIGELVREAIDRSLSEDTGRRFRAGQALLDAEPTAVDDWPLMKREIGELYERGLREEPVERSD